MGICEWLGCCYLLGRWQVLVNKRSDLRILAEAKKASPILRLTRRLVGGRENARGDLANPAELARKSDYLG